MSSAIGTGSIADHAGLVESRPARDSPPDHDAINQSKPIAHSTVQTLLRGLEEKGAVDHEADGRTFVFFALVEEENFKQNATNSRERVFGGNAATLVTHLLNGEGVSKQEIDENQEADQPPQQEIG